MDDATRTLATRVAALEQQVTRQEEAHRSELAALRRQMAQRRNALVRTLAVTMVVVLLLTPLGTLAANFVDLNPGSGHNANINAIADVGITKGCFDTAHYCPNDFVTREQMASFLARTAGLGGNPPVTNAITAVTATNATNATNAGHATTADTATTAQNATNAGHATTADTAVSAQTATNATQLGGVPASGYLRPVGDLVMFVAPAGAVAEDANVSVLSDRGIAQIKSSGVGTFEVSLPLPGPGSLFGAEFRLATVEICYRVSNAATFITSTTLFYVRDNSVHQGQHDTTDRTSTTFTCYTLSDPQTTAMDGGPAVRFGLNFTNIAHQIELTKVTATFTPIP